MLGRKCEVKLRSCRTIYENTIPARKRSNAIVVIVGVVVRLLLTFVAELNSRGRCMYRGGAAQIFVDKDGLRWNS